MWLTTYSKSKRYTYTHRTTDGAHLQKAVSTYNKGESLWYKIRKLEKISWTLPPPYSPSTMNVSVLRLGPDAAKISYLITRVGSTWQQGKDRSDIREKQ